MSNTIVPDLETPLVVDSQTQPLGALQHDGAALSVSDNDAFQQQLHYQQVEHLHSSPAIAPVPSPMSSPALQPVPVSGSSEAETLERLKLFLATAPVDWDPAQRMKRFTFPNGERISCILWNSLFHITGTDIVKILMFRFSAFGRPVRNIRKFEEGVFSDLRNLKPGMDASLEDAKSDLLAFLHQNKCIRTQKKQKVFYWFSVPHDRLFMDALERDLKREALGLSSTSESREKMDLTLTLELAKQQCRPIIELEDLEASNLDLEMQTQTIAHMTPELASVTPALSHASYDAVSSSTYMDLLSIMGHGSEKGSVAGSPMMSLATLPVAGSQLGHDHIKSESIVDSPRMGHVRSLSQGSDDTTETCDSASKVFRCAFNGCGRSFKRHQHLQRHVISHTGEKPFVCNFPGCGRGFSRADNLSVHQKRHLPPQGNGSPHSTGLGRSLAARQSVSPYFRKSVESDRSPHFPNPPMPSHRDSYRPMMLPMPFDHHQQQQHQQQPPMNFASLNQYAYSGSTPETQPYFYF